MSEPIIEQPTNQPAEPENNQPPYAEELTSLPEDVRHLVEPIFKQWDAKTTQKFQELHSQYEPWKDVITGVDPEDVQGALRLAELLDQDPRGLYDRLREYYKFDGTGEQGPGNQTEVVDPSETEEDDPRLSQLETMVGQLAEFLLGQQQSSEAAEQQKALDNVLSGLKESHDSKYGEFDEDFILQRLAIGDTPESAYKNWTDSIDRAISARGLVASNNQPPVVAPGTGGSTQSVTDGGKRPGDMSDKETIDVVSRMLREAAEAAS